jgi:hypothetical protein
MSRVSKGGSAKVTTKTTPKAKPTPSERSTALAGLVKACAGPIASARHKQDCLDLVVVMVMMVMMVVLMMVVMMVVVIVVVMMVMMVPPPLIVMMVMVVVMMIVNELYVRISGNALATSRGSSRVGDPQNCGGVWNGIKQLSV